MTKYKILVLMLMFLFTAAEARAEYVAQFEFTADTSASGLPAYIASATYDGSNLSGLSGIGNDGFGNVLETYPGSSATSAALALANDAYFTITITAHPGETFDLDTLFYKIGKGGASDPRGYFIRSSVDGYAADLYAETLPTGAAQAPALRMFNLSGHDNLSTVTFRFYMFTPDPIWTSVDWKEIYFWSSPTSIPTLNEWGMLLFAGILLLTAIRRLKKQREI